jgi:hypothetical protein
VYACACVCVVYVYPVLLGRSLVFSDFLSLGMYNVGLPAVANERRQVKSYSTFVETVCISNNLWYLTGLGVEVSATCS